MCYLEFYEKNEWKYLCIDLSEESSLTPTFNAIVNYDYYAKSHKNLSTNSFQVVRERASL